MVHDMAGTMWLGATGLGWALLVAGLTLTVRYFRGGAERYALPPLLVLYTLPPSVTALTGQAMQLGSGLTIALVAGSLALPLTVQLGTAVDQASQFTRAYVCGSRRRRAVTLVLPLVAAELVRAIGMLMPWVVLAAVLAEIAVGEGSGIGLKLSTRLTYGYAHVWPQVVLVGLVAVLPYCLLRFASGRLLLAMNLKRGRLDLSVAPKHQRFGPTIESLYLILLFAALWLYLNSQSDIIARSPRDVTEALAHIWPVLGASALSTALAAGIGCLLGCVFALGMVLVVRAARHAHYAVMAVLLPLQVLPIIVFKPLLTAVEQLCERWFWSADIQPPPGFAGMVPATVLSTIIGTFAAAYVAYELGRAELQRLPFNKSSLLRTFEAGNRRVLRHVYVPWLVRSLPATLEIAMPRVILAVLVTEYLVPGGGLGRMLAELRSNQDFTEAWTTLLCLLLVFVLLNLLTRSLVLLFKFKAKAVR